MILGSVLREIWTYLSKIDWAVVVEIKCLRAAVVKVSWGFLRSLRTLYTVIIEILESGIVKGLGS
jgi:hypothetical protein